MRFIILGMSPKLVSSIRNPKPLATPLRLLPRHIIAPGLDSKSFDDYDMQFSKKVISKSISLEEWKTMNFILMCSRGHVYFIELVMPALVAGVKKSSRSRGSKKPEALEQK